MELLLPSRRVVPRILNEREQIILQAVVQLYILHGTPVGSRNVSKYLERTIRMSPATVRNCMSDLEELGYIMHPHTSAGRVPTDIGYRFYVDSLSTQNMLSMSATDIPLPDLGSTPREHIIRDASRVLSSLSRHLGLVQLPQLSSAVVRRVEIVQLSSERFVIIIDLDSETLKTVSLETSTPIDHDTIDSLSRYINQRLVGRSLDELKTIFAETLEPEPMHRANFLRLFVEQIGSISSETTSGSILVSGTTNLLDHSETSAPERLRSVIELIENEDVIVHLLGSTSGVEGVSVRIGNEIEDASLQEYSLIATKYRAGNAQGSLGIIGPRRMDYARMISIVHMMSSVLTNTLSARTPDSPFRRL